MTTCRKYIDIAFNPKVCKELTQIRIAVIIADFENLIECRWLLIASGKTKQERFPATDEQPLGIID